MRIDNRIWQGLQDIRARLGASISLSVLNSVLIVGQAYALSQIVNRIFLEDDTLHEVQTLLLGLLILAITRFWVVWAADTTAHQVAIQVKFTLRNRLFQKLMYLGPLYTTSERSGELVNTLTEGIEALDDYLSHYVPNLFSTLVIVILLLVVVFSIDLLSGVVLLITAPLLPLFMILIGMWAGAVSKRQWRTLSTMSAHFLDVLQGLTTLKLFNRSQAQIKTISRISDSYRDTTMSVLRVAFLSAFALELLTTLSIAVIAVEIGLRLLYGKIAFEDAFFVLILAPEFYQPLRNLGASFHAARAGGDAIQRIFEILDIPPLIKAIVENPAPLPNTPFTIQFVDVAFTYPDREQAALDHISLNLAPLQHHALVGASGAGKSTIAHLLLRFIEPQSGEIFINGVPLNRIDPAAWRTQIAWVSQTPYLFAGSLVDNIRLAKPDATLDEIYWAGQQAHLDDFAAKLSNEWETPIGERGLRLSGGQAQRIALARAFLKDSPLLIWDEATANLDSFTEEIIQDSLSKLMQQRTVLMIAHRLNTIFHADQIIVLSEGRIQEIGSHQSLLEQKGLYHKMVTAYGH